MMNSLTIFVINWKLSIPWQVVAMWAMICVIDLILLGVTISLPIPYHTFYAISIDFETERI